MNLKVCVYIYIHIYRFIYLIEDCIFYYGSLQVYVTTLTSL